MSDTPRYRIVDAVFRRSERSPSRAALAAVAVAVLVHAAFWWWARRREASLEEWSAALAARIHAELARREVVDLLPPPPNPPITDRAEQPQPRARARPPAWQKAPRPPAEAGRVVAREPRSDTPLDLTKNMFVTGGAATYPGGSTASTGTNRVAVPTANVESGAPLKVRPGEPDHSRAVSLDDDEWRCPWPAEADTERIDEQAVIIRVKVRADGTAASARLVVDPGHGFGRAAVACALATRFSSARDRAGRPIEAESPPIRVRFTR